MWKIISAQLMQPNISTVTDRYFIMLNKNVDIKFSAYDVFSQSLKFGNPSNLKFWEQ
jgi:hypothetical protein